MAGLMWLGIVFIALVLVARMKISIFVWSIGIAVLLVVTQLTGLMSVGVAQVVWPIFVLVALFLNLPPLRSALVSRPALKLLRKSMPPISDTEREAI